MKTYDIIKYLNSKGTDFVYSSEGTDFIIEGFSSLQDLRSDSICWIKAKKNASNSIVEEIKKLKNILVVCPFEIECVSCIITQDPKRVFFDIINHFFYRAEKRGISDRATVLTDRIGTNVYIGPNSYIGEDVSIGDNTIIHPNVSIICPCEVGCDCEIYPGVVIGADGYGYYFENGVPCREKHFMGVRIGDNVDIGSNTCIDRGLLTDTIIKDNVKIDNLCHIGHNVVIEENCLIIAGSVICGSSHIEKNAYLSPGAVVINQITVEENGKVGANSLAINKVRAGTTVFGVPGKRIN